MREFTKQQHRQNKP